MKERLSRINEVLRRYDRDLFAKLIHGRIDICRRVSNLIKSFRLSEEAPPESQYLFSLTDDWKITGNPVDRGLIQIYEHLNFLDSWRDDSFFKRILDNRRREEDLRDRRFKNDIRAKAYDLRRDFAKATNDIRMGD